MTELAPIVLFVYNRPEHTARTLESLKKNEQALLSELYVFADGPKPGASAETLRQIDLTREIIRSAQWCGKVNIIESRENKGLAVSIMEGVSRIIQEHGKVIVLEDDLITAPSFLSFMNEALKKYENEKKVACISGYVYPLEKEFETAFFVKGADCWGWATWSDRWQQVNTNPTDLKNTINRKGLLNDFNFSGSYPYMEMLTDREEGKNQSWAILWYASSLVKDLLCLYPPYSLVHNIGNDGSGTHTLAAIKKFDVELRETKAIAFPSALEENKEARTAFKLFFDSVKKVNPSKPTFSGRIIKKIRSLLSK